MKITERQGEILNRIVQDYIDLAQPISSEFLEEKHHFGICPATIRIDMQKLTDAGFLYQPHTSAGRVPTDKGYRFFVDTLLGAELPDFEDIFKIEKILKEERKDALKWAAHLTKFLAGQSSSFTILHLLEQDFSLKEGWEEVLKEPEFEERDFISNFARLLENFEKNIENLKINSKIKIYIGRENPFPKANHFSIISSRCHFPEAGIIAFLGPKRMAYHRNISLIKSLAEALAEAREE